MCTSHLAVTVEIPFFNRKSELKRVLVLDLSTRSVQGPCVE